MKNLSNINQFLENDCIKSELLKWFFHRLIFLCEIFLLKSVEQYDITTELEWAQTWSINRW